MKLGKDTGSVFNHLYSRMVVGQPEPTVGMGATLLHWTDRDPATIIEVFKIGDCPAITVQEDTYKVVKGTPYDGTAEYEYSPDPNGRKSTYRFRKNRWEEVFKGDTGRWKITGGSGLRIGERDRHYDPSF